MIPSLISQLKLVKDPRKAKGKQYPLWVILILIIIAKLWQKETYIDIADFIETNQEKLIKYLKIPQKKLPSYSTIRRTMMNVESSELLKIANQWMWEIYPNKNEEDWLSIDGKKLRNTENNHNNSEQNSIMKVSIFSKKTRSVLKAEIMETKKQSEVHVTHSMIKIEPMQNKTFSGDAAHCNIELINIICDQNNYYLLAVKKNKPKLYSQIETYIKNNNYQDEDITINKGHGRIEKRRVRVFDVSNMMIKWRRDLKSLIEVKRTGKRNGKYFEKIHYYISNKKETAKVFQENIRDHWLIENQLHWVKDVVFNEDESKINDFQAASNFSTLTTIVINLYRSAGFISIKNGIRWLTKKFTNLFILSDIFT